MTWFSLSLFVWISILGVTSAFQQISLKGFDVTIDDVKLRRKTGNFPSLEIKTKTSNQILWKSAKVQPWLILADAKQNRPPIQDGNYQVSYELKKLTDSLTIDSIEVSKDSSQVTLKGSLLDCSSGTSCQSLANYEFIVAEDSSDHQVSFSGKLYPLITLNEIHSILSFACHTDESFHGFGESFTYFDLTGRKVPVLVSEQGVGRDEQPITDYLNHFVGEGVGGHWYTTYAPKPLFVTNYNRSFALSITETSFFDLTRVKEEGIVEVDLWFDSFKGRILGADSMIDLISAVSSFTGKQSVLPRWTQEGAIVGLEGGTESVSKIVNQLLEGGVPIKGVWLQDWVGLRHSWDGDRLIWNWEVNYDHYPGWSEMVSGWREQSGIRVLTYLNPFFSDPSDFVNQTELRHNFYQEGLEKGYFVKQADGSPYLMNSLSIQFATLDLTNSQARDWMKAIIINQTLIEAQSSGWMCDFGEYLPFDAVMSDGSQGRSYHNYYPQGWAELTREALEDYYRDHSNNTTSNEIVYFMRSAWTFSPSAVPVFWLGDQLMSWDGNDGLQTVITGALSSGLTGHLITHSDIGGYTAEIYNVSQLTYIRSEELLQRWTELAAFGFGLFRTHIGSSTSPDIAQIYDSPESIAHFARFAQIYAALADYRLDLMTEASERGLPLIRPLMFYYGYDRKTWTITTQYLVGTELLVAPCLAEGSNTTAVYFPAGSGTWQSIWEEDLVIEANEGVTVAVKSPIGYPPVFFRAGATVGVQLRDLIRAKHWSLVV